MKKKIILTLLLGLIPGLGWGIDGTVDRSRPNQQRWYSSGKSTGIVRIDYDGNFIPEKNEFSDVGESSHVWKRLYVGSVDVSSGIVNVWQRWDSPLGANTTGAFVRIASTGALVSTGAVWVTADFTQPDYPRNLTIQTSYSFLSSTHQLIIGCTIYGIDAFGKSRVDQFILTRSTNLAIRTIPWATISSFTVYAASETVSSFNSVRFHVGYSTAFGFNNIVLSTGDIYKIKESTGDNVLDSNITIDLTEYTIGFETVPNGIVDYEVWYINRRSRR